MLVWQTVLAKKITAKFASEEIEEDFMTVWVKNSFYCKRVSCFDSDTTTNYLFNVVLQLKYI